MTLTHSSIPGQLDDSRSCSLWPFYSQQDFQESWPPLWASALDHIQSWHLLRETGVCEPSPPPPPQQGRAWGWILVALLLTSSVTWAPSHFIPLNLFSQLENRRYYRLPFHITHEILFLKKKQDSQSCMYGMNTLLCI